MLSFSAVVFSSFSITSAVWSRKAARFSNSPSARTNSFKLSSRPGASGDLSCFHMSV